MAAGAGPLGGDHGCSARRRLTMRRRHRTAHAAIWAALALILPAMLAAAFALRGADPQGPFAERLPESGETR